MSVEVQSPWDHLDISEITGGVDISRRPEAISQDAFVDVSNLYYRDARLVGETGFKTFLGTVRGTPRAQFQFFKKNGTSENILITDSTIYTETNDQWQYISDGTSTTLSADANPTDTSITVADITGFSDGDFIGIELDDGSQHQTTINGAPAGSTINIDDAIPSLGTSGNAVVKAKDLTGTSDNQISIVVLPAFDYLVFTNGSDVVQYYDGTSVQTIPNLPSSGNTKCKAVAVFENHLLLIHTTEGGTAYPQRVRWSDTADPTEWTTGNAGYQDLYDSEDFCVVGVPLGPYMIIYKERSITRMEYVGAEDKLFNFDDVVSGEGAISHDGVVDVGTEHIFVGNANIYRYRGGFDVEPVGDMIWNRLFGKDKEVNPDEVDKTMCLYIEELDEVWVFYPDGDDTYPTQLARYSLQYSAWTFRSFSMPITGFGFFQTNDSLKWNELVGSWLAQTFKWGGAQTKANAPTTILLSTTGGNQAYEYDYIQEDDNGTAISWHFETKDFYNPRWKIRTNWLDYRAKGGAILIEYSLDGGDSWDTWASKTLDSNYRSYRNHKQVISDRIRFRFSGSSAGFGLERYAIEFMPESVH